MPTEREILALRKLPDDARRKFAKITAEVETLFAVVHRRSDERTALRKIVGEEEAEVRRLQQQGRLSHEFAEAANAKIAIAREQIADLDTADESIKERRTTLIRLVDRVFDYLNSIPAGHRCEDASRTPVKFRKGDTPYEAVQRCRTKITELRAELAEVEGAPIPTAIAKKMAARQIEQLAERGRPNVDGLVAGTQREAVLPENASRIVGETSGYVDVPDAFALIAHLMKDRLIEVINAEIDAVGEDEIALSPEDREMKIAQINAQIAEIEADEAEYMWQADRDGLTVPHRADIGIPALLGLSGAFVELPKKPQEPYVTADQRHRSPQIPVHSPLAAQVVRRLNDDGSYRPLEA
jgi:hypothetical protein